MDYITKKLSISNLFVSNSIANTVIVPQSQSSTTSTAKMGTEKETSQFSHALEIMDRFLENESNLLVQSLVSLENKTNISRQYLARAFLLVIAGYFVFSNSVLDLLTHILMFFYPSYRSYLLLKNDDISKEDLIEILKYWIFIGLFSTVDYAFGFLIPFGSVIKLLFIFQCVLPLKSPALDFAMQHFVTPVFRYLEQNENIKQVNAYLGTLSTSLKGDHSHQE